MIPRNNSVRASILSEHHFWQRASIFDCAHQFWQRASNLAARINFDKKVSSNARTHQRINSDGYTRSNNSKKFGIPHPFLTARIKSGSTHQFWQRASNLAARIKSGSAHQFWQRASILAARINFDRKVSSNARTHQRINSDGYTRGHLAKFQLLLSRLTFDFLSAHGYFNGTL